MRVSRRGLLGMAMSVPASRAWGAAAWPTALVMGTGRPGGYYTLYGPEWGILAETDCGVDIAFRTSGGAAENILLIEEKVAQLGMTTLAVAQQARSGQGNWTGGVKFTAFRALFPMYGSILQIVSPPRTKITSLGGLAGQVIGTGPSGGTGAAAVMDIFAAAGVKLQQAIPGNYQAQMRQLMAGRLAACAFITAAPIPAIADVARAHELSLIGFSAEQAARVAQTVPGMSAMTLKAGLFPAQGVDVTSVGTVNFAIGAASLSDGLARGVTLAALRNQTTLAKQVPAAAQTPQLAPLLQAGMPFHPGAVDALHKAGFDVPAKFAKR